MIVNRIDEIEKSFAQQREINELFHFTFSDRIIGVVDNIFLLESFRNSL